MDKTQVGRLALREVNKNGMLFWVAYFALPDTMEGAIELASIQMKFVAENEVLKQKFLEIMKTASSALLEEAGGGKVSWGRIGPAPEEERGAPPSTTKQ